MQLFNVVWSHTISQRIRWTLQRSTNAFLALQQSLETLSEQKLLTLYTLNTRTPDAPSRSSCMLPGQHHSSQTLQMLQRPLMLLHAAPQSCVGDVIARCVRRAHARHPTLQLLHKKNHDSAQSGGSAARSRTCSAEHHGCGRRPGHCWGIFWGCCLYQGAA